MGCNTKKDSNDTEELCRYTSRTFTPTEEKYHINEKEFLAVIKGLKKYHINLSIICSK